jgi:hypothetical protein
MNISNIKGIGKATIEKLNTLGIRFTDDLNKKTWQEIAQIKYLKDKQVYALSEYTSNHTTLDEVEIYRFALPKSRIPKTPITPTNSPSPSNIIIKPKKDSPMSIYDYQDQLINNIVKASEIELKLIYLPKFKEIVKRVDDFKYFYQDSDSYDDAHIMYRNYHDYFGQYVNDNKPEYNYSENQIKHIKKNLAKFWKVLAYQIIINKPDIKCDKCNNEVSYFFTKPENLNLCGKCTEEYKNECLSKGLELDYESYGMTDKAKMLFFIDMKQKSDEHWEKVRQEEVEERKKLMEESRRKKEFKLSEREKRIERLVATGKYEVCERCGGTGRYSWNRMDMDRCYGCDGNGVIRIVPHEDE